MQQRIIDVAQKVSRVTPWSPAEWLPIVASLYQSRVPEEEWERVALWLADKATLYGFSLRGYLDALLGVCDPKSVVKLAHT